MRLCCIFILFLTVFIEKAWQLPASASITCSTTGGNTDETGVAITCNSDSTSLLPFPNLAQSISTLTIFNSNDSEEIPLDPSNVESLTLIGNSGEIPDNAFASFKSLRELVIDFGQASSTLALGQTSPPVNIKPNAFKGLESVLKRLDLIGMNLNGANGFPAAVRPLGALEALKLDGNNLKGQLKGQDLQQMKNLRRLQIVGSPSMLVADDAFANNADNLEMLMLDDVKVDNFPTSINSLKTLREIQIKNAGLKSVPASALSNSGSTLKELRLPDNTISQIGASSFKGLSALITLNLINNQISTLPAGVFDDLASLESLQLSGNKLQSSSTKKAFSNLKKLKQLSIGDNQLDSIDADTLNGIENSVTTLYFSGNSIKSVKGTSKLTQSPQLLLASNGIDALNSGFFESGSTFSDLVLDSNPIANIQTGAFNGVTVGPTFAIDDTAIVDLDLSSLSGLKGPQNLTISNNRDLRTVKISDASTAPIFKFIVFDNNPKLVLGDDGKLSQYVQKSGTKLIFLNKIYCHCQMGWLKEKKSNVIFSTASDSGDVTATQCCNLDDTSVDSFLSKEQCGGDKANAAIAEDEGC